MIADSKIVTRKKQLLRYTKMNMTEMPSRGSWRFVVIIYSSRM